MVDGWAFFERGHVTPPEGRRALRARAHGA
jgi:hypothetical protein